ncbi:hypothetical protein VTN02DRAFT_5976 [Thermoascus thermophilus]
MLCCGDREKLGGMKASQKWDYINLDDFKSTSCLTPISYFFLWVFLLVSIAVYAVDTFTAVQLLVFNRWAGQIQPSVPFAISRWVFTACIILSFVLLIYRWICAIRAIRSGGVAQSYLDPLAVRLQSIRMGQRGRGWKRFLVFAELTKSKRGAEYVALFTYFAFESWTRVVFAEGPRQVINAITLYSVMQLNLIPEGQHAAPDGTSPVAQFFINVKALAEKNDQQAVVLFGMLFTLIIWVLSVLNLLSAVVLYVIFLWHHIPSRDGTLRAYCRRKINTRLERIVKRKVNKALAKGVVLQDRKPTQPVVSAEEIKPTLPSVGGGFDDDDDYDDERPAFSRQTTQTTLPPYLSRQTTQTTLPPYSRAGSAPPENAGALRQPTLPGLGFVEDKPPLTRSTTQASGYADSDALVGNAATMGYSPLDRHPSPVPLMPAISPTPVSAAARPYPPPSRAPTAPGCYTPGPSPVEGLGRRTPGMGYRGMEEGYSMPPQQPPSAMGRRTPGGLPPGGPPSIRAYSPAIVSPERTLTPVSASWAGELEYPERTFSPASDTGPSPPPKDNGGYVAFNPMVDCRTPSPGIQQPTSPTYRNFSRPHLTSPEYEYGGPTPPSRTYSPYTPYSPQYRTPPAQPPSNFY